MPRYLFVVLFICLVYLAANYFLKLSVDTIQQNDLAYIARHCVSLEGIDPNEIAEKVVIDGSFDGNLYIFDADPVLDSIPPFEIGRRGALSRMLCAPALGCLLPPVLSPDCQSGDL